MTTQLGFAAIAARNMAKCQTTIAPPTTLEAPAVGVEQPQKQSQNRVTTDTRKARPMREQIIEAMARGIVKRNWPSLTTADIDGMAEGYTSDAEAALQAIADAGFVPVNITDLANVMQMLETNVRTNSRNNQSEQRAIMKLRAMIAGTAKP